MKVKTIFLISHVIVIIIISASCVKEENKLDGLKEKESVWVIPEANITGGLNPFYLYDDPDYISVNEAHHLDSNHLVLVYKSQDDIYVYPYHSMLVEVVNDVIDNKHLAITFCPQTRSGIVWNRIIQNDTLLLTASGYLYKDNLMPYDVKSESIWSQMLLFGARGKFKRNRPSTFPLIETHWQNILNYFPTAKVFYMDHWKNSRIINDPDPDSTNNLSNEVPEHERVLGIIGQWGVELFQFELFRDSIQLYTETFEKEQLIVIGSVKYNFMVAFHHKYVMTPIQDEFPVIMQDNSGTKWNIFGKAVNGPLLGQQLSSPDSYMALGWAWNDLFDRIELFSTN